MAAGPLIPTPNPTVIYLQGDFPHPQYSWGMWVVGQLHDIHTPHPVFYTQYLDLVSYTQYPTPNYTQHPTPSILHPVPYTKYHNMWLPRLAAQI